MIDSRDRFIFESLREPTLEDYVNPPLFLRGSDKHYRPFRPMEANYVNRRNGKGWFRRILGSSRRLVRSRLDNRDMVRSYVRTANQNLEAYLVITYAELAGLVAFAATIGFCLGVYFAS